MKGGGKTMSQKTARLSMFSLILYNLTGGRIYMGSAEDPVGLLVLKTTGRKTGQPRSVSLVYIKSGSSFVISASNAGRDKHPRAVLQPAQQSTGHGTDKRPADQSGRGGGGSRAKKPALGATGESIAYVCALSEGDEPGDSDGGLTPGRVIW